MKFHTAITVLLVFLNPIIGSSQLIDVGTKWTYGAFGGSSPPFSRNVATIQITGDTIIAGEEFLVLLGGCDCSDPVIFLQVEDRRYYMYYDGAKHLLYDFNLGVGDVLAIKAPLGFAGQDSIKVRISGISEIDHEGQTLLVQELDQSFPDDFEFWADWGPMLVEGMGSTGFCFFPQYGLCETGTGPLRCVEFADGSIVKVTDEPFCDEFTSFTPWRVGSSWIFQKWGLTPANTIEFRIIEAGITGKQLVIITNSGDVLEGSEIDIFTETDKVYFIDSLDQKRLMYDFSPLIAVGDTLEYWLPPNANMYDISSNGGMEAIQNPYTAVVENISMVADEDGNPLRKYTVDPYFDLDDMVDDPPCNIVNEIVENVGAITGYLRMGCTQLTAGFGPEFRCFSNFEYIYKEVEGECTIVGTSDLLREEVKLFPNPFSEFVEIQTAAVLSKVEVYDPRGTLVLSTASASKVEMTKFLSGVYLFKLVDQEGRVTIKKALKL